MQNRPTRRELIQGVVHFLERDVVPELEEPLRFHTRVAANLLKIIEREADLEKTHLHSEGNRLITLLGTETPPLDTREDPRNALVELNEVLCREIRSGRADQGPWRRQVMDHIRQTLMESLAITNPKIASGNSGSEGSNHPHPKRD